jgi:hypothetical protein
MKELLRILGLFLVFAVVLTSCTKEAFFPIDGNEVELRDEELDAWGGDDSESEAGDDDDGGDDIEDDTDGINDGDGDDDEEDDGGPARSTE